MSGDPSHTSRPRLEPGCGSIDAGLVTALRNRQTRKLRWEKLDEDVSYAAGTLDRAVVARDQIRTVLRACRERLFTETFPGRTEIPKTLIFAKDDSHADDIVQLVREEFAKGDDFAVKITYKSTGRKPEEMLASFRNSYNPRIAVTVDMIATGTDVRPLECVFFMRSVKSRTYFEQVSIADALARAIDHGLRRSAALRRSLLQFALAGRLVAQNAADEPASALPARIVVHGAESANGRRHARSAATPAGR